MSWGLIGSLAVLALIDSTSFGTLLIPIWMMLAPGPFRPSRMLIFLGTVAAFYLVLGVALFAGADALAGTLGPLVDSTPFRWVQLVAGVGLLAAGVFTGWRRRGGRGAGSGRLLRWRERAMTGAGSPRALILLALAAAGLEAATMLPYLAAIGLLTASDLAFTPVAGVLAGYCTVMIAPALVLLAGRVRAAGAVQPLLERINAWMVRTSAENTAWILGILGFLTARDAAAGLMLT